MLAGASPTKVRRRFLRAEELRLAVLLLLLIACLVGLLPWAEKERPATSGGFRGSLPAPGDPLEMQGREGDEVVGSVGLRLQSVGVSEFPDEDATNPHGSELVEVRLPVPAALCERWRKGAGYDCDRPLRVRGAPFTLTWRRVKAMQARSREATWWALSSSDPVFPGDLPTTWWLESAGSSTRLAVACLESTGFELVSSLGTLRSRCLFGGRLLRLLIAPKAGWDLSLQFHGVRALNAHGRAKVMTSVADRGTASAGGEERSVEGGEEEVRIAAKSGLVRMGLRGPASNPGRLWSKVRDTDLVEVADANVVPTLFEKYEEWWVAGLIALALGLFSSAWLLYKADRGEGTT
ncbi:MAG TPA: hypothetical protein VFT79_09080 [Solirubrobacterales bacterium]|nr:hypothetical protein [Solirubrobacterales bacterium]